MAIPDYQTLMLPILNYVSDGKDHSLRETIEALASQFQLTQEERQELLPSGYQAIFDNRVGWSKTHILKAGLLDSPKRSIFRITERGRSVLSENPSQLNVQYLKKFPEYLEFIRPSSDTTLDSHVKVNEDLTATPEEIFENSYTSIRRSLAQDLLIKVKKSTPSFFERLVVELLVKMGYGGSLKDAGKATKLTNDHGIDGTIKEDKLGLDVIYIQAKCWESQPVGRPDIQSFVGALDGQRANKGIFITTSRFSDTAIEYVKMISKKVILIDGNQLALYMIDYGLGVSSVASYELKKIDNDYFGE